MKCVCGYEHGYKWNEDNEYTKVKGDRGEFYTSEQPLPVRCGDVYSSYVDMKTIYICPKCGTLKIDM